MGVMSTVPWWGKLGAKLVLSRLPLPYGFWRRLGVFRHGNMDDPMRAIHTFEKYYTRALSRGEIEAGFNSLELGPGDSILAGIVARAYGARNVWLVDAGDFADTSVSACRETVKKLAERGKALPSSNGENITEYLGSLGINYLNHGTESLLQIPDSSIDFFWSQVVLEHVKKNEFYELVKNLRRVVRPDSVGIHSIDFRDHLSGGLNNLRFSEALWEGKFFDGGGFYTNRLRPREILSMFSNAGFEVEVLAETRWPLMPIERCQLAPEFQSLPDEDFMVAEMEIAVRPTFSPFVGK